MAAHHGASVTTSSTSGGEMKMNLWLTLKLAHDWSSNEVSSLIRADNISSIRSAFSTLEANIKIRTLLTFLSIPSDTIESEAFKPHVESLLTLAENDPDEWVKVGAGLVRRWLHGPTDPSSGPPLDFLSNVLATTSDTLVETVLSNNRSFMTTSSPSTSPREDHPVPHDADEEEENTQTIHLPRDALCISESMAYLSRTLVPSSSIQLEEHKHFTVLTLDVDDKTNPNTTAVDDAGGISSYPSDAKVRGGSSSQRLTRPVLNRTLSSISRRSSAPHDTNSSTRRSVDPSRSFRRNNRAKIAVLDLDEVKAIKMEKAQRAEERKRQKISLPTTMAGGIASLSSFGPPPTHITHSHHHNSSTNPSLLPKGMTTAGFLPVGVHLDNNNTSSSPVDHLLNPMLTMPAHLSNSNLPFNHLTTASLMSHHHTGHMGLLSDAQLQQMATGGASTSVSMGAGAYTPMGAMGPHGFPTMPLMPSQLQTLGATPNSSSSSSSTPLTIASVPPLPYMPNGNANSQFGAPPPAYWS